MTGTTPIDTILEGDALTRLKELPGEAVDCCITSPPYFGLRDYGVDGQIGLEEGPEAYVSKLVEVFREVRRVLKKEGTCWLNLGDSFASGKGTCFNPGGGSSSLGKSRKEAGAHPLDRGNISDLRASGLKPKDLIGIPWMVAFALRADGWWLRSDIIWHKPNCMPESVTDRPTKAHEYIFLLSKSQRYYYDSEAIKEPTTGNAHKRGNGTHTKTTAPGKGIKANSSFEAACTGIVLRRNKRSVWSIPSAPFTEAHFATFPEKLIEPCILAGTSEKGYCPACGKPWIRQVKHGRVWTARDRGTTNKDAHLQPQSAARNGNARMGNFETETIGWLPSCSCILDCAWPGPLPGVVLDPFFGAGTTGLVAKKLGRRFIGIELSSEYCEIARKRIANVPMRLDSFASKDLSNIT